MTTKCPILAIMGNLSVNTKLFQNQKTVLVGLSGGPDSVCLLHYLATHQNELGITVIAAHLNHEWRSDAEYDVEFCKTLCANLGVKLVVKKASELDFTPKKDGSKESTGRQLRRYFFKQLATEYQATGIVLAHHQDDQIETFFIRLLRGSSITGLGAMQAQSGLYLRPLLTTSKETILDYLQKYTIPYLTDSTNSSDAFLRNRIRNQLVPTLNYVDQRSAKTIINTINQLQETEQFLQKITEQTFTTLFSNNKVDLVKLFKLDTFLQRRIITYWICNYAPEFTLTHKFVAEIIRFLQSNTGGTHKLGNWKLEKKQHKAEIKPIMQQAQILTDIL